MDKTPQQLGIDLRDAAIDRVESASGAWVESAFQTVHQLALQRPEFTSDAIWALTGSPPKEPRAMGAVLRRAMRSGIAIATDRTVNSVRPDCHRRPVRVWRSLIYRGVR